MFHFKRTEAKRSSSLGGWLARTARLAAAAGMTLLVAGRCAADYTYTSLNFPPVNARNPNTTNAFGINNLDQVVGTYQINAATGGGSGAFLYAGGGFTILADPNAGGNGTTSARAINDLGQVVGSYSVNGVSHGFLLTNGVYNDYTVAGGQVTSLTGINNLGQVIGNYTDTAGVGHAFLSTNGVVTTIADPLATAGSTTVVGINNLGQVVGNYSTGGNQYGFLYSNGVYTTIVDPNDPSFTALDGINNNGAIVGSSNRDFIDTNGVFTSFSGPNGLSPVTGINDFSQVLGVYSEFGPFSGFIATPNAAVPEPSSLVLVGIGGLIVGLARRRRSR